MANLNWLSIRWLVLLAQRKPILFNIALLIIAIIGLVFVIVDRHKKVFRCEQRVESIQAYYNNKIDTLTAHYTRRENELINTIIEHYKAQAEEQRIVNSVINEEIRKNRVVIEKANEKLNSIK